jgi:hypothetical protein
MKKIILLAMSLLLITGVNYAQDGGGKKKCCKKHCCKKNKKDCNKQDSSKKD